MLELIRRLLLLAGIAGCIILAGTTVPDLVIVAPVDFAGEMAEKYRSKPGPRLMGVMELAEEYLKKTTKPGSLQEYIDRQTEHRLIEVTGKHWEEFFHEVTKGADSPLAPRFLPHKRVFVFLWGETPLDTLKNQLEQMSRTWTVNYLVLKNTSVTQYLEVRYGYGFEPRNIGAPDSLVFPWRRYCWVPLLAGLAGFALLRSRRPQAGEIYHNYLGSGLPLDICGFFFFTLFFAIPFWVSDPTRQMWTEDLGVTILCWLAALGALSLVVWAAWNASFAIRVEPGRLVIARLFRSRRLNLGEIGAARPLLEGDIDSGVILELKDSSRIELPWNNMVNYTLLLDTLGQNGIHVQSATFTPTASVPPAGHKDLEEQESRQTQEISWQMNIPLLTDQFIMYDLLKVWGYSTLFLFLLMFVILAFERNWQGFVNVLPPLSLTAVGILILFIMVMLVFFGNRYPMGFVISEQGAGIVSLSRRGRWGNRLAVILGALAGKPGVAGAGLLGMARESVGTSWDEVRRLKVHPESRTISLMDSWHVVLRLYCTPQNYARVLAAVEKWAAKGIKKATAAPRQRGLSPNLRLGLKTISALVAAVFITALPLEVPPLAIWLLLAGGLGAIWLVPGRRLCGIVTLLAVSLILAVFITRSLEVRQRTDPDEFRKFARSQGVHIEEVPDWVIGRYRRFELFYPDDWLRTGIAGLGLSFFMWVGLAAVQPRRKKSRGRSDPDTIKKGTS